MSWLSKNWARTIAVAAFAATAAAGTANAFSWGCTGLAPGQTARVNVTNLVGTDMSCTVNVAFQSADGATLATARGLIINWKKTASFDLGYGAITASPDAYRRHQVRATATAIGDNKEACGAMMAATLEVFEDETGRTQVVLVPVDSF